MNTSPIGEALQRRMLIIYLGILLLVYSASVLVSPLRPDSRGEWVAAGLSFVGLALAIRPPLRGARYVIALACACTAPVVPMVFHELDVAQVWALIPLMSVAVYVRTWHRPAVARTVGALIAAAAVVALWVAPVASPWLWYLTFPVCILGAAEMIGILHAGLFDAALRDPLTTAWNRAGVDREVGEIINRARRRNETVAVIVLDVDDFKVINDRDGHAAGDAALAQLTSRWAACLPESAVIGRLGGDEFVVVLAGCDERRAHHVAAELAGVGPVRVTTGAAAGRPTGPHTFTALLAVADDDLYRAKRDRKPAGR